MSPLGGFYMEVKEEVWPRAQPLEIGPAWSFWYGIIVYGIADDNIFCFDEDNNIVLLSYYATGDAAPVDGSFVDCLLRQMEELEERKNKKIRGRDIGA